MDTGFGQKRGSLEQRQSHHARIAAGEIRDEYGSQTLDEMPPDQRVVVFNDLEWIKGVVAKAEDERMVCEHVYLTGSHIPRSVCMSARERAKLTEDTRAGLRKTYKCDDCRE